MEAGRRLRAQERLLPTAAALKSTHVLRTACAPPAPPRGVAGLLWILMLRFQADG